MKSFVPPAQTECLERKVALFKRQGGEKNEEEKVEMSFAKGSEAEVMPGREVWAARRKKLFLKLEFDGGQKLNSAM